MRLHYFSLMPCPLKCVRVAPEAYEPFEALEMIYEEMGHDEKRYQVQSKCTPNKLKTALYQLVTFFSELVCSNCCPP